MRDQRLIVLFGDSLFMDTVEASLEGKQEFGVMRIHTTVSDARDRLKCLKPDLAVFDLCGPASEVVLPLLWEQPGVPLLCLDVTCSRVIVLSSRLHTTRTVDDLAQVIWRYATNGDNGGPARDVVHGQGEYAILGTGASDRERRQPSLRAGVEKGGDPQAQQDLIGDCDILDA